MHPDFKCQFNFNFFSNLTIIMEIFDVLRSGISFSKSNKSKGRNFKRAGHFSQQAKIKKVRSDNASSDDGSDDEVGNASSSSQSNNISQELDFFGNNSGASASTTKSKKSDKKRASKSDDDQQPEVKSLKTDEVNALRKKRKIKVSGDTAPAPPLANFNELVKVGAPEWLQASVLECKFESPSSIQMQAIPSALRGDHILASAPTGSGKTMAFLIPMLARLGKPSKAFARGLVIDPTRELAHQTLRELNRLTKAKKFKGRLLDKISAEDLKEGMRVDIAVATPNRLVQLLKQTDIGLSATKSIVLDEADKLLDLGFAPQIDEILSHCNVEDEDLQILLFSATMPQGVIELADSILRAPVRISVGNASAGSSDIDQQLLYAGRDSDKLATLRQVVREGKIKPPALIFVQSKERAEELFKELVYDGIFVDMIHAGRTRQQRDNTVEAFRAGKVWVLICTDLMGRGVDFKGVNVVVNYDMPQSAETYIHRIGRTGRAGRKGTAITIFSDQDYPYLRSIVSVVRASGCEVPEYMKSLPKPARKNRKNADYKPIERWTISTKVHKNIRQTKSMREMKKRTKAQASD